VTIIGLDVTERVVMSGDYLAALRDAGTPEADFMFEASRGYQDFHDGRDGISGIFAHDPLAAVCAIDESPFTFTTGPVRVVTEGAAAGLTFQKLPGRAYPPNAWDEMPPQRVARTVDAARVLDLFAQPFLR
jgi:inosine-uridine nucleoside N-ribohydrolase